MTYPNVLVTEYLKAARRAQPDVLLRAMELLNIGYQRLLTFEVPGGGFEWYGRRPADLRLSALGLAQFADLKRVYDIDERVIERTRKFLHSKQAADGSWGDLALTAYITWVLAEAGESGEPIERARTFLRKQSTDDPYVLGLLANALPDNDAILARLDGMKQERDGAVFWQPQRTLYYATGKAAAVEATSLIAMAMVRAKKHAATANKALSFLVKARDSGGAWGSTQATVLALKALVAGTSGVTEDKTTEIVLRVNDEEQKLTVTPDTADVMRYVNFKGVRKGKNTVRITGRGEFIYQVVGRYYLPWSEVREEDQAEPMTLSIEYDRSRLTREDTLKATVRMRYHGSQPTFMVILDVGVPGGFTVVPDAFEKLQAQGKIDKFQITSKQIIVYLGKVEPGQEMSFSYELKARYPIKVKTPPSSVYEYYAPDRRGQARPVELEVLDE